MLLNEVRKPHNWAIPLKLTCSDIGRSTECYIPFLGREEVFNLIKSKMAVAGFALTKARLSSRVHYQIARLSTDGKQ